MRKVLSVLIAFSLCAFPVRAEKAEIDTILSDTADFVISAVPNPQISSIGGEWAVIGLYKSGRAEKEYLDAYYESVESTVKVQGGVLSSRKYTEYSRVVLALTLIGKDPENVSGYNLVAPLCDYDAVTRQGLNGAIWALIALDSGNYGDGEIKEKYITKILESELEDGGWSLSRNETAADCDVTAMALTALSSHLDAGSVKDAVNRGIDCLLKMQNSGGGFSTYGEETAESTAQVLTAISTLGIGIEEFSKNGVTPLDALLGYYKKGEGFSHTSGGESNLMATEQALYALTAVKRRQEGKSTIFAADKFCDISGNASEGAILALNEKGIINGMGGRIFAPENRVTRAEFATIAVKALGLSEDADCGFSDVAKSDWFYSYVAVAYKNGIVYGISDTEFNPQGEITCEEAAAMLQRAAQISGIKADFEEYPEITSEISDWARDAYAFCLAAGILKKDKAPKKVLNRAEIAQMVYNMLEKAEIL